MIFVKSFKFIILVEIVKRKHHPLLYRIIGLLIDFRTHLDEQSRIRK